MYIYMYICIYLYIHIYYACRDLLRFELSLCCLSCHSSSIINAFMCVVNLPVFSKKFRKKKI